MYVFYSYSVVRDFTSKCTLQLFTRILQRNYPTKNIKDLRKLFLVQSFFGNAAGSKLTISQKSWSTADIFLQFFLKLFGEATFRICLGNCFDRLKIHACINICFATAFFVLSQCIIFLETKLFENAETKTDLPCLL